MKTTETTPELAYGLDYTDDARKAWRLELVGLERRHFERGCRLARALRGEAGSERGIYFLTPARAEKWQTLYDAGFDARAWNDDGWRFVHRRWPHAVGLTVAMQLARAMRVVNQALSQTPTINPTQNSTPFTNENSN